MHATTYMTDSQASLPVDDNLSSSARNEYPTNRPAPSEIPSTALTQPITQNVNVKEKTSADPHLGLVPPIRNLITRGGFRFPSFESLNSHHFSRAHAASDSPIQHHASTELRASLAKLESLLQEAACLAERVTFHEAEATDARSNEEKEVHGLHVAKHITQLIPTDATIAQPVVTVDDSSSIENVHQDATRHEGSSLSQADIHSIKEDHTHVPEQQTGIVTSIGPTINISPGASMKHGRSAFLHPRVGPRSSSLHARRPQKLPTLMVNGVEIADGNDIDDSIRASQLFPRAKIGHERHYSDIFGLSSRQVSINLNHVGEDMQYQTLDLRSKSHVDVYNKPPDFDIHRACRHGTIARNWPNSRKRFTALIACVNTGCIGLVLGIYAGEVPAIQYAIADLHHYTILGNVLMYSGIALTGFVFWPLPLLHGRKPYVVAAQLLALVLQVPQGLAVNGWRDPSQPAFRCLLLVSRAMSGLALGLADMNIKATLLDCFGASLQSRRSKPNKDLHDVRNHGGGMGMWLGFASWSMVGPISIGFMIGASIVSSGVSVVWGFWVSFCFIVFVLLVNMIMPEVRRSAFRRTLSELTGNAGDFSRVTRGEIRMHLTTTGPY